MGDFHLADAFSTKSCLWPFGMCCCLVYCVRTKLRTAFDFFSSSFIFLFSFRCRRCLPDHGGKRNPLSVQQLRRQMRPNWQQGLAALKGGGVGNVEEGKRQKEERAKERWMLTIQMTRKIFTTLVAGTAKKAATCSAAAPAHTSFTSVRSVNVNFSFFSEWIGRLDAPSISFFFSFSLSSISTGPKKAADPRTWFPCVGGVSILVRTCAAATSRTYVSSFPSIPPLWDGAGCLKPPLAQIPPGDWSCEYCINSDNEHEHDADAGAAAGGGDAAEGEAAVTANGDAAAVQGTVRMPVSGSFTPPMAKVGNSGVPPPTLTAATSATPASALVSSSSSAAAAAIAVAAAAAAAGSAPTLPFPPPASPYSSPPGAARAAVTPTAAALVAQHTARNSSRGGNRASAGSREGSPAKKVRLSSTTATAAAASPAAAQRDPAFDTHPGNSEMVMAPFVAASVRSNASSAAKAAAHQYPVERSDTAKS